MNDHEPTPLEAATGRLYDHFGIGQQIGPHWIASIGYAAKGPYNDTDRIHVYVTRKPMAHQGMIPTTWEGFPVVTNVVGKLHPA